MLGRLAPYLRRLPAPPGLLRGDGDAVASYEVGRCAVCGKSVNFDDNFVSWDTFITHLGCAFVLPRG